jgi:7,8-dihydropterin-6-yl-methyl-4-(beta-D-ribofuranosyl)aminobenzene 5'-phosphate synthase
VISSCGHVGVVNSVRQARRLSGVPDVIIPMHCSGNNFIQAVRQRMPDKLLVSTTGSRIGFGA